MTTADPQVLTTRVAPAESSCVLPHSLTIIEERVIPSDVFIETAIDAEYTVSSCRDCHHYEHEGRRGGQCQRLNVRVQSEWSACPLAIGAFGACALRLESAVADLPWIPTLTESGLDSSH